MGTVFLINLRMSLADEIKKVLMENPNMLVKVQTEEGLLNLVKSMEIEGN
mgnify:CR=1 FL=1